MARPRGSNGPNSTERKNGSGCGSALAQGPHQPDHGHHERDPDAGLLLQRQPLGDPPGHADEGEVDVGRPEQPDEQAVTARGGHGQEALAHRRGRLEFPHRHAGEHQHDAGEKYGHGRGPSHPLKHLKSPKKLERKPRQPRPLALTVRVMVATMGLALTLVSVRASSSSTQLNMKQKKAATPTPALISGRKMVRKKRGKL